MSSIIYEFVLVYFLTIDYPKTEYDNTTREFQCENCKRENLKSTYWRPRLHEQSNDNHLRLRNLIVMSTNSRT